MPSSLLDGLVAYYPFDEGSGTIARDISGNGKHATLYNSPTWTTGLIDGALSFNGTNQYAISPVVPKSIFTFVHWVKYHSFVNGSLIAQLCGSNGTGAFSTFQCGSYSYSTGQTIATLGRNSTAGSFDYVSTSGTWICQALTMQTPLFNVPGDNFGVTYSYINGQLINSFGNGTWVTNNDGPIGIGAFNDVNSGLSGYMNATICGVAIWYRELTQTELQLLYNNGKGLPYPFGQRHDSKTVGPRVRKQNQKTLNQSQSYLVGDDPAIIQILPSYLAQPSFLDQRIDQFYGGGGLL